MSRIDRLLSEVPTDLYLAAVGDNARLLTSQELEEIEEIAEAHESLHTTAQMGLEVVADYLYKCAVSKESENLNEASALLAMLADIVYATHTAGGNAQGCIEAHYKRLAENKAADVASQPAPKRKRGAK